MDFQDKTVVITGGSSGIGRAIARQASRLKAKVMIIGRNAERLQETASYNHNIKYLQADLLDPASHRKIINTTVNHFGSIDVLINNAGILKSIFVEDAELTELSKLFNLNVFVPVLLAKEALPYLKKSKGHIINIGSCLGHIPEAGQIGYGTSKAAVEHLSRNMALELAKYQIKVNCIAPGPTETPILKRAGFTDEMIAQSTQEINSQLPLRRRAQPDEIADIVTKICDPSVSWLTGQVITVDGGMSIA